MYRLANKKGNTTTMRIVRDDNNDYRGCIGTLKDLYSLNIILGNYPCENLDKWLFIKENEEVLEFNSKEEIKTHLGIESRI